ncbi:hypothetical protein CGCF413_v014828 [Colletotrichum fructicola]|nr:hypothetical protein CGCF413_v014828 [Colletotrichum fructicola]
MPWALRRPVTTALASATRPVCDAERPINGHFDYSWDRPKSTQTSPANTGDLVCPPTTRLRWAQALSRPTALGNLRTLEPVGRLSCRLLSHRPPDAPDSLPEHPTNGPDIAQQSVASFTKRA